MGINRSATVAMAVLMNLEDWTLKEAHDLARSRRSCVQPFPGNKNFIAKWELETRGKSTLPEWLEEGTSPLSKAEIRSRDTGAASREAKLMGSPGKKPSGMPASPVPGDPSAYRSEPVRD